MGEIQQREGGLSCIRSDPGKISSYSSFPELKFDERRQTLQAYSLSHRWSKCWWSGNKDIMPHLISLSKCFFFSFGCMLLKHIEWFICIDDVRLCRNHSQWVRTSGQDQGSIEQVASRTTTTTLAAAQRTEKSLQMGRTRSNRWGRDSFHVISQTNPFRRLLLSEKPQ